MPDGEDRQCRYIPKSLVQTLAIQANNSKLLVSHERKLQKRKRCGDYCSCALPVQPGGGDGFYLSCGQLDRRARCAQRDLVASCRLHGISAVLGEPRG